MDRQNVIPMIAYENGAAAMDWLARAFGFQERTRMMGADGSLAHGEMETGGEGANCGMIMLATPSPEYQGPKHHREGCQQARAWSNVPWIIDGVLVYVDDVGSHFQRAKQNGATILSEIDE